ncbi:SET domain-containing protein [Priestia megaterium]|uniref:SET domain-containing protein n=1 Tax=Priestia megaterium TaxID=1404 RepID=UPI000BF27178|nr:SET domain-containing protein [Priestia megaterium]PFR98129.1 SET domain-containing protein-lysine N-methyltransferase [Priestia megaterium]
MKDTQKYGRGIYAMHDIKKGQLIEVSPIILSPQKEWKHLEKTVLSQYGFRWGENFADTAIALGYGSLFNHSYTPNAIYYYNEDNLSIEFYAEADIKKDEEITINYNGDPKDKSPLWFDIIK